PYQTDDTLTMQLEVTDELGLTGNSIATPVDIIIQAPESGFFPSLGENGPLIITGVIVLSGVILFLVLVIAGRIRPRRMGERRKKRKASQDPVTQPIKSKKEEETASQRTVLERITRRIPSPRFQWPSRTRPTTDPYGYLVRVEEDGEPKTESLFPITVSELTFGSDTKQAVIALDDPSVEPLHARLWREENGTFYIEDSGSIAGTWVNYGSADENGMPLEHGDLIHIGKIGYRFTLSKPAKVRKPVVIPLDGSQPEEEE
ncbi:MAG: FHA domain-containing protein, partial [Anaerolineales bacterium]